MQHSKTSRVAGDDMSDEVNGDVSDDTSGDTRGSGEGHAVGDTPSDAAERALAQLVAELDRCVDELERAQVRAGDLLQARAAGRKWLDVVSEESRPLVVESISTVLGSLATAGHAWRREQAAALRAEQVSINRIAGLFGVTRQRISALLRERDEDAEPSGRTV